MLVSQSSSVYGYFEPLLQPWVHFVPYSRWFDDLPDVVRRLQANDSLARRISQAGVEFDRQYTSITAAADYTAVLLTQYSRLLDHDVSDADVPYVECTKEVREGPMGCGTGWRLYNRTKIPFPDWLDPHRDKKNKTKKDDGNKQNAVQTVAAGKESATSSNSKNNKKSDKQSAVERPGPKKKPREINEKGSKRG